MPQPMGSRVYIYNAFRHHKMFGYCPRVLYMTSDILNTLNALASVSNLTILLITHFLLQFLQFESGGSLEVYEEDLSLHH